jgi:hypothetical protein
LRKLFVVAAFAILSSFPPRSASQSVPSAAVLDRVIGNVDENQRVTLKGNVHPLARTQFDHGAAPGFTPTGKLRLLLQRSTDQQQSLTQYLSDVQNPSAAAYHKWLTPSNYGAAFGVSDSDLFRIESWLQSHGLKIEKAPRSRNFIEFSGDFDQVQSAFHTAIHSFSMNGQIHFANVSDPQIPAALASVIAGIGPLNDFRPRPTMVRGPQGRFDPSTGRITPELTLTANNSPYLFVGPADAATIYDSPNTTLNPNYAGGTTYDGNGVAVGIVGIADLTTTDVANYRIAFLGEASGSVNLPTVIVDGNDPGMNGAATEAVLDNEIAGGIAPKAKLYFYTSADSDLSSGLMNAMFRALDDNIVSILSISFNACEAAEGTSGNQIILEAMEQAAAQGITVVVSAGDNGSAGCDAFATESVSTQGFGVNALASSPYTIAVGGTDFDVLSTSFATYVNQASSGIPPYYGTALKYIPENPWNDSTTVNNSYSNNVAYKNSKGIGNIVAGSGGASTVYAKPAFQATLTPQDGFRDLPDVALLSGVGMYGAVWVMCSDNLTDGVTSQTYTECLTSGGQFTGNTSFGGAGGTSASAPAFAGMLALAAQAHGSLSDNYRLGQANNILYRLASTQYSKVFHDVTAGNNSVPCASGSLDCGSNLFLTGYNAGTGYDLASGLGSVDAAAMVNNWSSVVQASTSTTLNINGSSSDYTGVHGASLKFDVDVNPSSATGLVGIVDNANETSGGASIGVLNNGQFAIPIMAGAGSSTYNGLPGGSYKVWARYGGDAGNAPSISTPPINITITSEPSTTTLSIHAFDTQKGNSIPAMNIPYGSLVLADAQITGTAEGSNTQGVATGTVTFTDLTGAIGSSAVSSGNQASWPPLTNHPSILPAGPHSITASYSGDPSYNASTSQPVSFTIVQMSTTTVATPSNSTLTAGQSTDITFTVSTLWNPGATPTGTVTLSANNTTLATINSLSLSSGYNGPVHYVDLIGFASISTSQLSAGLNTITVAYSGDSNYAASSTMVQVDSVTGGGGVAFAMPNSVTVGLGATSTFTVTLTSSGEYSGFIAWGCYSTPSNSALSCWIPETHVPLSGSDDSVLVLTANGPVGTYTLNINGIDLSNPKIAISKTVAVTISATSSPSLAVMNNGSLNVAPGSSAGNTTFVSVIPSGGLTGQVNLACSVTTALSNPVSVPTCTVPSSVTLNGTAPVVAQVQVNTTSATTAGSYNLAITATSGAAPTVATTDAIPLAVSASPSFALSSSGTVTVAPGVTTSDATSITLTPLNGFAGQVNLFCYATSAFSNYAILPACSVPSSVNMSGSNPVTVAVSMKSSPSSMPGFYIMIVGASAPSLPAVGIDTSPDLFLAITPVPSFTLGNSGNIQLSAGATSNNTSTITLTPSGGFAGAVNLTCSVTTPMINPVNIPTCSLASSVLNLNGTNASTILTVSTTAPTRGALMSDPKSRSLGGFATVLAIVFLFCIPAKRHAWPRILGVLVLFVWIGALGCGGGGSGSGGGGGSVGGTTAGVYSVAVTATDATTGKITALTTVTVTVN